jgi:hypothetical protein
MPWGRHRGADLADVPESYLQWALENAEAMSSTLREAIRARLGLPAEPPDTEAVATVVAKVHDAVRDVHRAMAVRFHPDKGGSNEAMIAVNHMHDCLQSELAKRLPKPSSE